MDSMVVGSSWSMLLWALFRVRATESCFHECGTGVIIQGSGLNRASAWGVMACDHCSGINSFNVGFVWVGSDRTVKQLGAWLVSNSVSLCPISPELVLGHSFPWGQSSPSALHSLTADYSCPLPTAGDGHGRANLHFQPQTLSAKAHLMEAQQGGTPCPFPAPIRPSRKAAVPCYPTCWCGGPVERGEIWLDPSASKWGMVVGLTPDKKGWIWPPVAYRSAESWSMGMWYRCPRASLLLKECNIK